MGTCHREGKAVSQGLITKQDPDPARKSGRLEDLCLRAMPHEGEGEGGRELRYWYTNSHLCVHVSECGCSFLEFPTSLYYKGRRWWPEKVPREGDRAAGGGIRRWS